MHMSVCLSVCRVCVDTLRGQKEVPESLGLELQAMMNHLMWVPRTKLRPSEELQHPELLGHLPSPITTVSKSAGRAPVPIPCVVTNAGHYPAGNLSSKTELQPALL